MLPGTPGIVVHAGSPAIRHVPLSGDEPVLEGKTDVELSDVDLMVERPQIDSVAQNTETKNVSSCPRWVGALVAYSILISAISLYTGYLLHLTLGDGAVPAGVSSVAAGYTFLHLSDFHLDLNYHASASQECFCRASTLQQNLSKFKDTCGPNHLPNPAAPYSSPFGRFGCDSPASLIESALAGIRQVFEAVAIKHSVGRHRGEPSHSHPLFAVITGDFSAHEACIYPR